MNLCGESLIVQPLAAEYLSFDEVLKAYLFYVKLFLTQTKPGKETAT